MLFHVIFYICHKTMHFQLNRGIKMTQTNNSVLNHKIGQRFKELIKEFDGTQEITAMYLNYCKTTISRYCSGVSPIPDDVIKKLSKKWKIREEYIKCIDDIKTINDMFFYELEERNDNLVKIINHLEILGFKLSLSYWITCSAAKYETFKDIITPYIHTDSSGITLCYPLEYDVDANSKFLYELFSHSEIDHLIKNNYMSIYIPITNLETSDNHLKSLLKPYFDKIYDIPTLETIDFNNDYCCIAIGYLAKNNGCDCGFYTIHELERLCHAINSHTKCCIDLFLSGKLT